MNALTVLCCQPSVELPLPVGVAGSARDGRDVNRVEELVSLKGDKILTYQDRLRSHGLARHACTPPGPGSVA